MALAALRDRIMLLDGSLAPWTSPGGLPMRVAAAAPEIPWTDLAYSLMPNGRTLDYVADAPYGNRIGVEKQSFVTGLYALGQATSNYAPPGTDPDADLTTWYALINAGEPYEGNPPAADITDEVTTHHSSYYIDHSEPPAPLLISNGWTDDLFPPDEAIRFYNRTRTQYPGAQVNLFFMDYGHQRGQNKAADTAVLRARQEAWFDYYLKGVGGAPVSGQVETLTKVCGGPSAGPYFAATWAKGALGEVRYDSTAPQTISPAAGDPTVGQAFDPITGPGACARASGSDQPGAATYRLPAASGSGYTLMGSPTVIADINSVGPNSQIAARLLDVAPDGTETLVARALYRPDVNSGAAQTRQVFQLHPDGWKFAAGHLAKLELLPNDAPYGRVSNGQLPVTVSNLQLRLPVLEKPKGGVISSPAPKVVPAGYTLARDFAKGR
jgi:predicted acyl esterase